MMDRRRLAVWMLVAASTLPAGPAAATMRFGPLQISGNIQSQNIIRTPDAQTFQFIQNRNVARIRFDYDWLQGGKFMNNYDIPFIQSSKLFVLWRGVYDSVYDTTPQIVQKFDIHERAYGGGSQTVGEFAKTLSTPNGTRQRALYLSTGLTDDERDTFKFENQLREALVHQRNRDLRIGEALIELGYASEETVARALAKKHGLKFIDLTKGRIAQAILDLVPGEMAGEIRLVPLLEREGRLLVAIDDPMKTFALDNLRFVVNRELEPVLAHDLVDELHLLLYPLTLGRGKRLWADHAPAEFTLRSATPYPTGVVGLDYLRKR